MSKLFYQKDCSSTNDEISQVLLYPNLNFIGLYTFNQKNGRGQYGNSWISAPEENLAYTLAIKAENIILTDFLFNYYTAILIQQFLVKMTDSVVEIKWPNDIIIKKKKVTGILIEKKKINEDWYFIVGIGINILQKKFDDISNAGSLFTQTEKVFDLHTFTQQLQNYLVENYPIAHSEEEILEKFNQNLFRKNVISVFELNNQRQNGIIKYADAEGKLWIELENGLQSFYLKQIKLLY
ncbi:MAG: biotin--[acetyl-CoA-carboxylase] ligase [Chryseobacterium sp.]|nr:biotin--[acetyl-CoA-carboxylase] ligase [Candidatus Chryseobacterium enterohippi]